MKYKEVSVVIKKPRFCEEHVLTLSGIIPFDETVFASLETWKSVLTTLLYKLFLTKKDRKVYNSVKSIYSCIRLYEISIVMSACDGLSPFLILSFDLVSVVNKPFFEM